MFEVSESLDKKWSREKILSKIKSGAKVEQIVNDFILENKKDFKKFSEIINKDNHYVLANLISLSECELELLRSINNLNFYKANPLKHNDLNKKTNNKLQNEFSLFMNTWSNKFVIMALIMISLISLTKQAWV
tara:strand:+ start:26794 stop:27192 length:399 start_codon:yes stop_codon:yes gene_type:complete